MKKRYHFVLSISLLLCSLGCFAQLDFRVSSVIDAFGDRINKDLAADNVHGSISIAVMKNGRVISLHAYGYASYDKDILADTTNIYRIGSITKSFTATLVMTLVEEGRIKLDDAVDRYLPEIKNINGYEKAGVVTFRQLASHTSGLKREPEMEGASVGPIEQWEEKVLASIPHTSFNSQPGKEFLYSNIGYALLGLAIERIVGIPYLQLVQQRIFAPLHMTNTFFVPDDNTRMHLAQGIENSNGRSANTAIPLRELTGRGYRVPNGGIFSTPADLSKFVAAMAGKTPLLSAKSLREMQKIPDGGRNYGLGLIITKNRQIDVIGHNGSVSGYTARYAIEQESGYAVILMRNYNVGSTNLDLAAYELLSQLKKADR